MVWGVDSSENLKTCHHPSQVKKEFRECWTLIFFFWYKMEHHGGIIRLEEKSLFGLYNLVKKLMVLNNTTFLW